MLNFTSALYLGLRHDSQSLGPFSATTTGVPAVLQPPPGAPEVAAGLARLLGTERAALAPSTLHILWELPLLVSEHPVSVHYDEAVYPISEWGAERARGLGVPVAAFPHHDVEWLAWQLGKFAPGPTPVLLTDTFCPGCGRRAPLAAYLEAVREHRGIMIVDDTQALGVLGASAAPASPFGQGGGGAVRAAGLSGPDVIVVASLAKAFGAPIACVAGSTATIERYEETSETRMHCSPPSVPAIRAAGRALHINAQEGDALRARLWRRTRQLREGLARLGRAPSGEPFPVQRIRGFSRAEALRVQRQLSRDRVQALVQRSRCDDDGASVTFLLTARHSVRDVDQALEALASALRITREASASSMRIFQGARQP